MTPGELKSARQELGLSMSQLASVLGVQKRTLQYWETDDGKRPVHPVAATAIRWLLSGYRPANWPQGREGGG